MQGKPQSRRSFFASALSGAAGLWVAVTGGAAALATLAAACRNGATVKYGGPPVQPSDGPGGPAAAAPDARPGEPAAIETKYGGPSTLPPAPEAPVDAGFAEPPPEPVPVVKYGGPPPTEPAEKYGGPASMPARKYGGPSRPSRPTTPTTKYGGPITTKYGGPGTF